MPEIQNTEKNQVNSPWFFGFSVDNTIPKVFGKTLSL